MHKMYLFISLSFFCTEVLAQGAVTTDTIQWDIEDVYNVNAGMHDGIGDRVLTFSGERVEWTDATGNTRFQFNISEVEGAWGNINEAGMLTLNFQFESQPGQVVLKRVNDELVIEIRLYMNEASPQQFQLKASTYSVL